MPNQALFAVTNNQILKTLKILKIWFGLILRVLWYIWREKKARSEERDIPIYNWYLERSQEKASKPLGFKYLQAEGPIDLCFVLGNNLSR